jgi:hypothetical protein
MAPALQGQSQGDSMARSLSISSTDATVANSIAAAEVEAIAATITRGVEARRRIAADWVGK